MRQPPLAGHGAAAGRFSGMRPGGWTYRGPGHRYRARFFSSDAARLKDLFELVGRSDATEVLIDDRPVPYARELWLPLVWFLLYR